MKKQDIGWESLGWKLREKVGKRSEETECRGRPCLRTAGLSGAAQMVKDIQKRALATNRATGGPHTCHLTQPSEVVIFQL